jgi:hypothetical protein
VSPAAAAAGRYADLCSDLEKQLPSFPPAEGETKPITFKRILLNTCQDEFEAAADARRVSVGRDRRLQCLLVLLPPTGPGGDQLHQRYQLPCQSLRRCDTQRPGL